MAMRHGWKPLLASVEAQTLIIHGRQEVQSIEIANMYREATGIHSRVEEVDEAGHFMTFTQAARVAQLLRRHFLEQ